MLIFPWGWVIVGVGMCKPLITGGELIWEKQKHTLT